uniref:Uncharacterized protein n=1 Tax=Mycena chlorophos TaxID=658473 RepID=A0ABQ0LB92_MYCCL|nr:predicted protein [Mycena chlorophos]
MKARVLCHELPDHTPDQEPGSEQPTPSSSSSHSHITHPTPAWSHCDLIPDLAGGPLPLDDPTHAHAKGPSHSHSHSHLDVHLRLKQSLVFGIVIGMLLGLLLCAIPFLVVLRKFKLSPSRLAQGRSRHSRRRERWAEKGGADSWAFPEYEYEYEPFLGYDYAAKV